MLSGGDEALGSNGFMWWVKCIVGEVCGDPIRIVHRGLVVSRKGRKNKVVNRVDRKEQVQRTQIQSSSTLFAPRPISISLSKPRPKPKPRSILGAWS